MNEEVPDEIRILKESWRLLRNDIQIEWWSMSVDEAPQPAAMASVSDLSR